ncbi:MAG: ComF family protein [Clostridiaceae bacterium]|nr:ComF family protein [Clostridiaceae bacterium]
MKKIFEIIVKLLFPPKCIFCLSILDIQEKIDICHKCRKILGYMGNKLYYVNKYFCKDLGTHKYFDRVFCVFEYSGIVKDAIIRYKYFGKAHYYKTFARLLAGILLNNKVKNILQNANQSNIKNSDDNCVNNVNHANNTNHIKNANINNANISNANVNSENHENEFDMIISVPLHKEREKERGYNQACLVSKELSRIMKLPEISDILIRKKNTSPQSLLHGEERSDNIKNAFEVADINKVKGKKILLVDDVLTTGSTVNECSRTLKKAGAVKVDIAVIAVAFVFEL